MAKYLNEKEDEDFWDAYNSKVYPIELARGASGDKRIWFLLVTSDSEAIGFNRKGRRVGILVNDEIPEFIESHTKLKTVVPSFAPDEPEVSGVGHYFDDGILESLGKIRDSLIEEQKGV